MYSNKGAQAFGIRAWGFTQIRPYFTGMCMRRVTFLRVGPR
jgi:hypothetical protein